MKKYIQTTNICKYSLYLDNFPQKKNIHSNNSPNIHQGTKVHPLPKLSAPLVLSWQVRQSAATTAATATATPAVTGYIKNMPSSHVIST